jgi:hypothetical protein
MRLTYTIGCVFVAMAMVVCWRYLPARAAELSAPDDARELDADELDLELASALAVTDA